MAIQEPIDRIDTGPLEDRHFALANRQMLDVASDVIFTISYPELKIGYCNRAAREFFRTVHHSADPQTGSSTRFLTPATQPVWDKVIAGALAHGWCEMRHDVGAGGRTWLLRVSRIDELGACIGFVIGGSDITDHEQTRVRLARSETLYQTLFHSMGVGAVYHDSLGNIIGANRAAEEILGRSRAELMGLTSEASEWDAIHEDGSPFAASDHPAMVTLRTGKPVSEMYMGILRPDGERRWLFINSDVVNLAAAPDQAAVVVTFADTTDRRELRERLKAQLAQLDRALDQTLVAMSDMVEMRDPYTAGHQRQVARLAEAIAIEMGLSVDQCQMIRRAGLVHDIGKMAIPAEILVKPRRLTEIEYDLVKQHVEFGYRVLDAIEFAQPIAAIMRQHHERLDGSGYPLGLTAKDIMLESRIVTLADVVDSIASHRPYRGALGIDVAIAELQRYAGIWYDEAAVAACVRVLAKGELTRLYDDPSRPMVAADTASALQLQLTHGLALDPMPN